MKHPLHYLLMLIVIAFGVTVGNISSDLIKAKYTSYKLNEATKKQAAEIEKRKQSMEAASREIRKESLAGRSLKTQCNDWKKMNAQRDSITSREKMTLYCDAYIRYIGTGSYDRRLVN